MKKLFLIILFSAFFSLCSFTDGGFSTQDKNEIANEILNHELLTKEPYYEKVKANIEDAKILNVYRLSASELNSISKLANLEKNSYYTHVYVDELDITLCKENNKWEILGWNVPNNNQDAANRNKALEAVLQNDTYSIIAETPEYSITYSLSEENGEVFLTVIQGTNFIPETITGNKTRLSDAVVALQNAYKAENTADDSAVKNGGYVNKENTKEKNYSVIIIVTSASIIVLSIITTIFFRKRKKTLLK